MLASIRATVRRRRSRVRSLTGRSGLATGPFASSGVARAADLFRARTDEVVADVKYGFGTVEPIVSLFSIAGGSLLRWPQGAKPTPNETCMSIRRLRTITLVGFALAACAIPSIAHACSVPFEPPRPTNIPQADLRFGFPHVSTRSSWEVGDEWVSSRPFMDQQVRLAGWASTKWVTASFRQQQSLTVEASWPESGATASDDSDPATPPCEIAGRLTWSAPTFLVRETTRSIVITSMSRQTKGSREGCLFQENTCNGRRTVSFRLDAPVGNRRISLSRFG